MEVLRGKVPEGAWGMEGRGGKPALFLLQFDDPLFDRARGDQFIDEDGLCLADAVGAVGRLVLDRRVPPGVVMDHRIRRGEVQAAAPRLQADQENRDRPRLKAVDRVGSIAGSAGQLDIADVAASSGLIKSSIEVNCENTSTRRPSLASSRNICIRAVSLLLVTAGISPPACDPDSAFRIAASLTRRGSQHTCGSFNIASATTISLRSREW